MYFSIINIKNVLNSYSIRLFIDNSIYKDDKIMKLLKRLDKLEIVVYNCPMYQIGDYHQGLFGTLIRFFPMFNFPNNDASTIIITDIDSYSFKKYNEIFKILNNKIEKLYLIKLSNASKMFKNKEDYNHIYDNIILDYIKPQEIICLKQIDYNVIIDFLDNLDTNINYSYYYNENNKDKNNFQSKFENNGHFIYGIDEYFLNNNYLHYFIDNKKPFVDILKFNIASILYYQVYVRNESWLDKNKLIFNNLLNKLLKKIGIKNTKEKDLIHKFNSIIEEGTSENILSNKYILYNFFMKIKDKKKYFFMINSIYNNLLSSDKYNNLYEFVEYQFHFVNIDNFFIKYKKIVQ
jgi:hypothetical protein